MDMRTNEERTADQQAKSDAVLMYPVNQLKDQFRDYEETFSPLKMLERQALAGQ